VSAVKSEVLPASGRPRRNPRAARMLSIVPGLGQLYAGSPKRAAQYLAGVVIPLALVGLIYRETMFDIARLEISGLLKSLIFLCSELVNLALVISGLSFWIAASWDAEQAVTAANEGRGYQHRWWFVKVKEFLFDDPEEDA
jgi:hypothetical protein